MEVFASQIGESNRRVEGFVVLLEAIVAQIHQVVVFDVNGIEVISEGWQYGEAFTKVNLLNQKKANGSK